MTDGKFGRFGDMLRDGLRYLAPVWLRRMFLAEPAASLLRLDRSKPYGLSPSVLLETQGKVPKPNKTVDVVFPADIFLRRKISIPPTSRGQQRQVAAMDLVRRTPFKETEVHWALSDSKDTQATELEQWIIKKIDLSRYRQSLYSHGYQLRKALVPVGPHTVTIADFTLEVAPRVHLWRRLNAALLIVIIGFCAVIWLRPALEARAEVSRNQIVLDRLRNEALDLRAEVARRAEARDDQKAFIDTVLTRPRAVDALRQMTVALPDTVWLSDFLFTPSQITVNGETSQSAAELVLDLTENNRTRLLPALSGPVSRTAQGNERFGMTFRPGGDSQ